LLAPGLLASLLLNFNSAALHGNSDGMSNQTLNVWGLGWVEKSDFLQKSDFWGEVSLIVHLFNDEFSWPIS
jgi:hypothetical protein